MSHHAHGTNKVHGRASRTRGTAGGASTERFSYRDLHPEMYTTTRKRPTRNQRLSDEARRQLIIADLRKNGPGTATGISARMGISREIITPLLRGGIEGVGVVGRSETHAPMWGLRESADG